MADRLPPNNAATARLLEAEDPAERRALEQAAARFLELSPDLFCIVDFEGTFRRVNPALESVLGYPQDELAGSSYLDFIHPDDVSRSLVQAQSLATEGGEVRDFRARIRQRDGSYRSVLWTSKSSPDERLIYTTGGTSPSARKPWTRPTRPRSCSRRRSSRRRSGWPSLESKASGPASFLRVNRSLCEITGLSESDLVGTNFQAIVHPDDVESELHYVRWMLTDDIAQYEVEKRLRHADGHTFWALVTVSLVRDVQGDPLYLISQVQDVTARKEAERDLWESRERLQDIIDNTTAVIYLKDQDGRYLLVNDRFEMLHGIRRDEAIGKTDHDLFPPEIADTNRANDLKVLATGIALDVGGGDRPRGRAARLSQPRGSRSSTPTIRRVPRTRSARSPPTSPSASTPRRPCARARSISAGSSTRRSSRSSRSTRTG